MPESVILAIEDEALRIKDEISLKRNSPCRVVKGCSFSEFSIKMLFLF